MANDSTPVPEKQVRVTLETPTPEDDGATTDGRGGYMGGESIPGGGAGADSGSST